MSVARNIVATDIADISTPIVTIFYGSNKHY
jgi:hypothetical protein